MPDWERMVCASFKGKVGSSSPHTIPTGIEIRDSLAHRRRARNTKTLEARVGTANGCLRFPACGQESRIVQSVMELYQVAPYNRPADLTPEMITAAVVEIERFPADLRETLNYLSSEQLATKTLPGNWTVAQVVHHTADSHMNAFIRCKLALTEDQPTIKPYEEAEWARMADAGSETSAQLSLDLLTALHARWVRLLRSLKPADWKRGYFHPGSGRVFQMEEVVYLYAWHGRNHLAHIHQLMKAKEWV